MFRKFDVRELFGFLQCSTCSKFNFGPKCDVRKVRCSDIQYSGCSKFGILVFVPRLVVSEYMQMGLSQKKAAIGTSSRHIYMLHVSKCSSSKKYLPSIICR